MKLYGKFDGSAITDISCNLRAFGWFDDVYYTTKEAVSMYDVYVPFEENWDADWLPYNCTIVEDEVFSKMVNIIMKEMSLIIQKKVNELLNIMKVSW
jgi:hypothetical protein